jgi:hypothetical protein
LNPAASAIETCFNRFSAWVSELRPRIVGGLDEATATRGHGQPGADLSTPERILLFCVASDTEWKRAGILVVIDRDDPDQIDVEVVHKALMIGDAGAVHVAQLARRLGVGPGVGELDAALILDRRNRDAGWQAPSDASGVFGADAVRELASRSSMLRQNASRASTVGVSRPQDGCALPNNSGNRATFIAIRRASSAVSIFACCASTGLSRE